MLLPLMALDQQSNWDIQMSQPFRVPARTSTPKPVCQPPVLIPCSPGREILLPTEIISQVLQYVPRHPTSQPTLWACTLISRAWYASSISLLYDRPYLNGSNFDQFVTTVCPSKNAHIKISTLATLVRRLDMGGLVHDSSKSLTARLLGRLKGNLEDFVAPQASFGINSFAALSKCTKLHLLDLSLISASISNKLLFQSLKSLQDLETLFFPRSSSLDTQQSEEPYYWPPRLRALHLAGGTDDHFLRVHLASAPATLQTLSIQHCSQIYGSALLTTLSTLGHQLQHLTIRHPMSKLQRGALDQVLMYCTSLVALRISADYISNELFLYIPDGHPLRILDLECSPQAGADVEISPLVVYEAVEDGKLKCLRSVRVSARLAWMATFGRQEDASDIADVMEENDADNPLGIEVGVWASLPD